MNNISKIAEHQCTGCGACYNICPVGAITMEYNKEGFLQPVVNEKCINCGKCLRVCPAINDFRKENIETPTCIAMQASDEIRMKSSSGGIFTVLAEKVLEEGGIVIGSAFKENWYGAEHRIASNKEELILLRGSKYVQSELNDVYKRAEKALKSGKKVLFTGCPCQVAGLYGYLGKDYSNLYTVDLVCHGVPSGKFLEKFVKEEEEKADSKTVYLSFRDKKISQWGDLRLAIDFQNGKKYRGGRKSPYYKAFLDIMSVRKSCGSCKFATFPRQGDITIADFWDIHRYKPDLDDHKGTSLILINNEKGKLLCESIKVKTKRYELAPLEHAIKYNRQIKYSSVLSPKRGNFIKFINKYNYPFEKAVDYASNYKYDIGYIGWWYGKNWGSMMTSFAINRVLTKMGKSVLMLPWPSMNHVSNEKQGEYVRTIADNYYFEARNTLLSDYSRFNKHCDMFLVGSDQLWNWWSNRDIGTYYYFLDFADDEHKKISYSTSFGHTTGYYPKEMKLKISYLLHRFDAISVREKSGVSILKDNFDVDAQLTMDPVFLCDLEDYDNVVKLSKVVFDEKYVLGYLLNPSDEKLKTLEMIANKKGLKCRLILDGQSDSGTSEWKDYDNVLQLNKVEDWLAYFKNAEYIVTDSFHGFCYSIIFSKQMIVFPNKQRGTARFETIGQITGLDSRFVYDYYQVEKAELWNEEINFSKVQAALSPHIDYSKKWLEEALAKPKKEASVKELMLEKIVNEKEIIREVIVEKIVEKEVKKKKGIFQELITSYKENGLICTIKKVFKINR